MKFKNFCVSVRTHAFGAAYEYPSKSTAANTASSFIPSRAGEQFFITVENNDLHDVSCIFYVDGQMASVLLCYAKPKHNLVICQGVQPQPGILRRFVFSKATLTDDSNSVSGGNGGSEVGVIRVVIRRCVVLAYDASATFLQFNSPAAIDEKSHKGLLDTKTELATEEKFKNGPYANVLYLDNGEPHAEFSFTYKSMDLLQAMGVVPFMRPPPPTLAPTLKRSRYDEDEAIREENKRLKLALSRLQRERTEPLVTTTTNSGGVKMTKKVIQKEVEIVDLTDD